MKKIINIEMKTRKVDFIKCKTDLLAVGLFSDVKKPDGLIAQLDKILDGAINKLIKLGDFKGGDRTTAVLYGNGEIGARRVLLIGLGEKKKVTLDTLRKASAVAGKKAVELKAEKLGMALHDAAPDGIDTGDIGRACAEGVYFGGFRYDEYITESKDGRLDSLEVELIDPDAKIINQLKKGLTGGIAIGKAQSYARTIANRPGNIINPVTLAAEAKKMVRGAKRLSCTVFDEKQLTAKGMGGILAVGSGSKSGPRFIVIKYTPQNKPPRNRPRVALVGKAITFDSGGISIKPAANMDEMKLDKTGGVAVLATMKAIAELAPPIEVYGIIPSAENLPSGSSYRPGDIVNTYSGKSVEVQNTDAEGRMVLCDGLHYAVEQKCDIIIDIATLTGACLVALGRYYAGLMGNDEELIKQLQKASEDSGEKVWPMPSGDEYAEEMKSKIADLKNIGSRWGGACTAAAFLRQFISDKKWAHLDIAGMDMFQSATDYASEGSSGFGVRLLTTFLTNIANKKN